VAEVTELVGFLGIYMCFIFMQRTKASYITLVKADILKMAEYRKYPTTSSGSLLYQISFIGYLEKYI
jgi:hypothetical protein